MQAIIKSIEVRRQFEEARFDSWAGAVIRVSAGCPVELHMTVIVDEKDFEIGNQDLYWGGPVDMRISFQKPEEGKYAIAPTGTSVEDLLCIGRRRVTPKKGDGT